MATKKNLGGRPTKMTKDTKMVLVDCFRRGLTDEDACSIAGISPPTLYDYCKKYPKFSNLKETLKNNLKARAKIKVADAIDNGDMITTRWYLERKCKDEFSSKQIVDNQISGGLDVKGQFSNLSDDDLKNMLNGDN